MSALTPEATTLRGCVDDAVRSCRAINIGLSFGRFRTSCAVYSEQWELHQGERFANPIDCVLLKLQSPATKSHVHAQAVADTLSIPAEVVLGFMDGFDLVEQDHRYLHRDPRDGKPLLQFARERTLYLSGYEAGILYRNEVASRCKLDGAVFIPGQETCPICEERVG